jgi:DNA-binding transcriptional LysR family regulator
LLVAEALRNGTLARVGTVSIPAPSAYYLVYPRGRPVAKSVHDFRAWILAEAGGD